MKIALLNVLSPNDRFIYGSLTQLATELDIDFEYVREQDDSDESALEAWGKLRKLIDESDAFFLTDSRVLQVPQYVEAIHKRIAGGARLLIRLNENDIEAHNAFLARYELISTRVRIRSRFTPTIDFTRSADSFRDFRLFSGIEKVTAQQPNAIWYGGESLPILVGADEGLVSDGRTDLEVDWNTRELASMAGWQSDNGGGVLAVSGNYLGDHYAGTTGVEWPGIESNPTLAKNVLRYLAESLPADSPYGLVARIEVNLGDWVLNRLRESNPNWWLELVPPKIQEKCQRRESSEGKGIPAHGYLDLIDLKVLIEKNWNLFEFDFKRSGDNAGKSKLLSWLNRLNELRKYIAHSLKQHVSQFQFSTEDLDFLKSCDQRLKTLRLKQ